MVSQKINPGAVLAFKKVLLFAEAVFLVSVIAVRLFPPADTSGYDPYVSKERFLVTAGELERVRSAVKHYYENNHSYPNSLAELRMYVQENPGMVFRSTDLREHITTEEGNGQESNVLDGSGGWFYDKATGEVKLNITRPVVHYLGPAFYPQEIPADW
jgi:hypothetical protein